MNKCPHCSSELRQGASFCLHCGAVQAANLAEPIECENHGGEHAVGLCVLCGKPVCGDCALSSGGRTFCENAQHQTIFREWSVVHESEFEFETDMIQRNIASAGIETKIFSFRNYLGTLWLTDVKPVRVLVPRERRQQAIELLQNLRLLNTREDQ